MDREWDQTYARLAACGEYWFDARESGYRLTWKGAFFHAWRLTDPIKRWRTRIRDWRARRQWRALGMHLWRPPAEASAEVHPTPAAPAEHPLSHRPGELPYETALPAGEVRHEWTGPVLTVRAGTPTVGDFLAGRWFLARLDGLHGLQHRRLAVHAVAVLQDRAADGRPARAARVMPMWAFIPLAACVMFFLLDSYKLVRGILIARRGTAVLTANPTGLTYRNAPAWRGSGHVARDKLDGLVVRLESVAFRGKTFRLEARRQGHSRPLPLITGRDPEALQNVAEALGEAMGIGFRKATEAPAESNGPTNPPPAPLPSSGHAR